MESKINRGIFECPNCNERLDYKFKTSTILKEAQKQILEEIKFELCKNANEAEIEYYTHFFDEKIKEL